MWWHAWYHNMHDHMISHGDFMAHHMIFHIYRMILSYDTRNIYVCTIWWYAWYDEIHNHMISYGDIMTNCMIFDITNHTISSYVTISMISWYCMISSYNTIHIVSYGDMYDICGSIWCVDDEHLCIDIMHRRSMDQSNPYMLIIYWPI